jgi:L-threonylcarbamoyladenylate synthase
MLASFESTRHDTLEPFRSGCTTQIWKFDSQHPESRIVSLAGTVLSREGVIVYPTETFYGLGGDPKLPTVAERIFRIKGRELSKPLPLIASSLEAVYRAVAKWPISAEKLSRAFWPGPLTLVLRAAPHILSLIHGNTGRIAIRVSSHPVAQALAAEAGGLLIATSANQANHRAYQTASEMPGEFLALVDGLIDAGQCGGSAGGLPSTIVDASALAPRLIRAGCIPWEKVLGAVR